MLLGHYAASLAAKRLSPAVSLGTLFLATQLLDLLWGALVAAGVERVRVVPGITAFTPFDFINYPYSHSLLLGAVWASLFALPIFAAKRAARGALVVWALVVSHWFLDWVTHRRDLPLVPGEGAGLHGLGLWHSVPLTFVVEGLFFALGLRLYLRATRARDKIGSYAFWAMVALMVVIYVTSPFMTPPEHPLALGSSGVLLLVFAGWGHWVDRHREPRAA